MTIGSDGHSTGNHSNGTHSNGNHSNGNHSNGATAQDRFSSGVSAFRQGRREAGDTELTGRPHQLPPSIVPELSQGGLEPTGALERAGVLPPLDLHGLTEPVFGPGAWVDAGTQPESMADHPLLRGLLLELPARGTMPTADWLDRWFEAARSILELLYVQGAKRG